MQDQMDNVSRVVETVREKSMEALEVKNAVTDEECFS